MAKDKSTETVKEYAVLQNLRHSGKHYNPKSKVELTDDEAKPLLASKVVELAK